MASARPVVQFRFAKPHDSAVLGAINTESFCAATTGPYDKEKMLPHMQEFFRHNLGAQKDPPILIAAVDGKDCGFIRYKKHDDHLEVCEFYTLQPSTCKVGSMLFKKICSLEKPKEVRLFANKDAISIYENFGFVRTYPDTCQMHMNGKNLTSWKKCKAPDYPRYKPVA